MMLMACVHRYYASQYGTWDCNHALNYIFREYRPNLTHMDFR